jgi:hypothetical protein
MGLLDFVFGIYKFSREQKQRKEELALEATLGLAETNIQLAEAGAKKGALEAFLTKMPTALQPIQGGTTGDLAFDQQYRALLQNYGNINVLAGLTGQVGAATSQALGGEAEQQVGGFVETQAEIAQRQIDIYGTTLENLDVAKEAYEDVLGMNEQASGSLNTMNMFRGGAGFR